MCKVAIAAAMVIRLVYADRVPESVLREAQRIAGSIFAHAGVLLEWSDCRWEKCGQGSGLWLQFMEQPSGAAGYAVIGQYAVIRYPVVEAAAKDLEVGAATTLGATMAHEIGHLLLGTDHARHGVMVRHFRRAEIQHAARGELQFTREEAQRIRRMLPTGVPR